MDSVILFSVKDGVFMDPHKTGCLIAKLRKEMNLTQKDLADKLSVTAKAISRWETGRGYPDIEILPELSRILNISINELLNGELSPKEIDKHTEEAPILYICNNAAKKQKKSRTKIIWLSVILGLTILSFVLYIILSAASIITSIDPNCVIAHDYSYIIYQNEKYLPIETHGFTFCDKDELVDEATVEGTSIFSKLLFGDSICSVVGADNNSVIHLETDYDFPPSEYYAKEGELKNIEDYIEHFNEINVYTMDLPYALFSDNELVNVSNLSSIEFWESIFSLPEHTTPDTSLYADNLTIHNSISVVASNGNNLLYKAKGEIFCKNNKYYWVECKSNSFDETYNPHLQNPYLISEEFYPTIEALFLTTLPQ